ncbi:uncharacterized protein LOC135265227 [Tribolium castaneum]|uniref:uncharacterized protein LOC135265227 n=1 Tax=Tribolium castaneum TaxID=7070 RepID=UPI0030FEA7F5
MKRFLILFLVVTHNCSGNLIIEEVTGSRDNSMQVNVSAGYGVRSENTTIVTPSPQYQFSDRKENETVIQISQDQISQPSQNIPEILPTPSYQVHEKTQEVQEKNFQIAKSHRFQKRYRQKKHEEPKNTEMEQHKEAPKPNIAAAGTKIVEVLRVPAMYELHLQSDPQRLASLNTAFLTKLMNQNYQYKRPVVPQFYQSSKNYIPQQSMNYIQTYGGSPIPPQRLQNLKNKYVSQKLNVAPPPQNFVSFAQTKTPLQTAQTQNLAGFKHNLRPQSYPTSYQNVQTNLSPTESAQKYPSLTTQTPTLLSNEIPADFYQKPQALHEVPAPILNKQPLKPIKGTPVPSLVYGKPVEPPYQPSTQTSALWGSNVPSYQPSTQTPTLWGNNNVQDLTGDLSSYRGQVDSVPNYYQEPQKNYYNPHNQDYYNHPHYQGPQNVQHYYNAAFADHLDQNLANVNGGVATYLNPDGTMTVSNFHHNPKLYRPSPGYEIPVSENQPQEQVPDYGLTPYQNQNLANFNNEMYSGYSPEIPVNENQIETSENQEQNTDLNNLLVGAATASLDEAQSPKFGRGFMSKRIMYGKPVGKNRRMAQPMDYILYIKERIFD